MGLVVQIQKETSRASPLDGLAIYFNPFSARPGVSVFSHSTWTARTDVGFSSTE